MGCVLWCCWVGQGQRQLGLRHAVLHTQLSAGMQAPPHQQRTWNVPSVSEGDSVMYLGQGQGGAADGGDGWVQRHQTKEQLNVCTVHRTARNTHPAPSAQDAGKQEGG